MEREPGDEVFKRSLNLESPANLGTPLILCQDGLKTTGAFGFGGRIHRRDTEVREKSTNLSLSALSVSLRFKISAPESKGTLRQMAGCPA